MVSMKDDFIQGASLIDSVASGVAAGLADNIIAASPLGSNSLYAAAAEIGGGVAIHMMLPAGRTRDIATNALMIPGFMRVGNMIAGMIFGGGADTTATQNGSSSGLVAV